MLNRSFSVTLALAATSLVSSDALANMAGCAVSAGRQCLITTSQVPSDGSGYSTNIAKTRASNLTLTPGYTLMAYQGRNRSGQRIQLQATPNPQANLGWANADGVQWLWIQRTPQNLPKGLPTAAFNVPNTRQVFSPLACANEGGQCTVPTNSLVAFGAGESFTVLPKSGRFSCSNMEFGDPAIGIAKACFVLAGQPHAARQVERLNRGAVAIRQPNGSVFIGWRLLATDAANIEFNVYHSRHSNGDGRTLLTTTPLKDATHFVAPSSFAWGNFTIVPVVNGTEQSTGGQTVSLRADPWVDVDVQPPTGRLPGAVYTVGDATVGDLDGDGEYEIIVKWTSRAEDNSIDGVTDNTYVDAYRLSNRGRLWRINLGPNIRSGGHYTPIIVYDFDGDGRAELAMRTSDGTVDGRGRTLGSPNVSHLDRWGWGRILSGPEHLTFFRGTDGAMLAQTEFRPSRGDRRKMYFGWGDDWGNRSDRFLGGVAYLDGQRPSLIMARGYYARTAIAAWDLVRTSSGQYQIVNRWIFDTHNEAAIPLANIRDGIKLTNKTARNATGNYIRHPNYDGQGAHSLKVADVDFDGRDDIVYGAAVIRHDGTPGHSTLKGHGDALQVGDFNPERPGLEIMTVHEEPDDHKGSGLVFRRAEGNGSILWDRGTCASKDPRTVGDVGRGIVMDVNPRHAGAEAWSSVHAFVSSAGRNVFPGFDSPNAVERCQQLPGATPLFGLYWDGDLLREIWGRGQSVEKFNWQDENRRGNLTVFDPNPDADRERRNLRWIGLGNRGAPLLVADILGDWREEFVLYSSQDKKVRIFTTTIPTNKTMLLSRNPVPRLPTLMHDTQYRAAVASQNSAYNQQPNPSFFLGEGMVEPAVRPLVAR
jgi:rhamnogalacturonan endolyase